MLHAGMRKRKNCQSLNENTNKLLITKSQYVPTRVLSLSNTLVRSGVSNEKNHMISLIRRVDANEVSPHLFHFCC